MAELNGRELLSEWRKLTDSMLASTTSIGGRAEAPRRLLEPMQRRLELVQEVLEREEGLRRQLTSRLVAPVDSVFDLLEENAEALRKQAEALETAVHALKETAGRVRKQAELFDRMIVTLREPAERAKAATGLEPRVRRRDRPDLRRANSAER